MIQKIRVSKAYILAAVLSLLSFILIYEFLNFKQIDALQKDLSASVVRLHVIANSNSKKDQELKLFVRNKVIEFLSNNIDFSKGKYQVLKDIDRRKYQIESHIKQALLEKGKNYKVRISIQRDLFPNRVYNNFLFPSGIYDCVKVFIGDSKGKNWWCVIFPPLCIVDEAKLELPAEAREELKSSLSKKEYLIATSYGSMDNMPVKLRLKIYEILKTKFYKEAWFRRIFRSI
ncbi:Sporulation stage II protein R [Caldicellulosiruptor owensensis OL]|uniref:Sporulation stage II protein R n=1 Tax=Caldicellulosiruptor owensensis (strain ATCC 700167 / DSM 13100 / OL) TaxID=632518 RepID=E4Q468_CALOW|nr:stage II sporulation protein R [Caldicellulosiruptor owensensis]ADQ05222.1 Sporulation stage II protein R [Caldicellulosiruptor owensensis OL]